MKRYVLFADDTYYPSGGWYDYVSSYDTVEEAVNEYRNNYVREHDNKDNPMYSWYHILDITTMAIIDEEDTQAGKPK